MLRSILIGLDGSAYSSAAIELGIRWARRFDALLVGLGVVDHPTICKPEPIAIGAGQYKRDRDECLLADARRRVDGFLEQFAERCASQGVRCEVLEETGLPCTEIVEQSRFCDLILLGQQTYFHFETQNWPDETLREVLRHSSRPIVTVPERLLKGTCVVIAYDGSPQADRAIQAFQSLGLKGEDEVHVVSIHNELATAARMAKQVVDFLTLHGVRAAAHPLRPVSTVKKIILAKVDDFQAHLLVMGAYGRSMWREFVLGSTTTSILGASPVPLFLCH
jgi:nucleotide-binding universal stress UspA family protein